MGREVKLFIVIAFVGAFIGAGIVIAVKLPKNLAVKKEIEQQKEEMRMKEMEIDLTDLQLPSEFADIWSKKWYPYRPKMEQWTKEQAQYFDVDPEKIGSTILENKNDTMIGEIYSNVP